MAAFPTASVEEAGLCLLDPAELPPHWGFGPGSLPHIGASPDAMLRHRPGLSDSRRRIVVMSQYLPLSFPLVTEPQLPVNVLVHYQYCCR